MTDVIREVVIRGRMEVVKTDLKGPDLSKLFNEWERRNKMMRDVLKLQKESGRLEQQNADKQRRFEEERRKAIELTNKQREDALRTQREINDAFLRGGEGARTLADGAFTAARGFALLGLEGGEGLEQVVKRIADIQGKFDLFRGSVDVIKGGVETTRNLSEGLEAAANTSTLLSGRLGGVVKFLGPTGTIGLAVAGTTVAFGLLWDAFADDADDAIARTEKRVEDLRKATARVSEQRRIASESAARLSAIQTDQQRLASISNQLGGIGAVNVEGLGQQASALQARDAAQTAFEEARRAAAVGSRFNPSEASIARRQQAIRVRDRRRAELDALGGSVSGAERDLLSGRLRGALSTEKSRFDLLNDRRSTFEALSGRQDAERAAGIREAETQRQRSQNEAQRLREQLESARRDQQVAENTRKRELAKLTGPQRAFVTQTVSGLDGAAADGFDANERRRNKRLLELVPSYGGRVRDAETVAAGGTPVDRGDRVSELESRLADAVEKLAEATKTKDERVAADAGADDRAESAAERIANAFERSSNRIEQLEGQLQAFSSQIQEAR